MQEEPKNPTQVASAAPRGPATDPSLTLPKALRPSLVAIAGGGVYLLGASFISAVLLVRAADEAGMAIAVWAGMGALLGPPLSVALARLGYRTEISLLGVRPPARGWWFVYGLGIAVSAHWAPLCPWTFLLIAGAAVDGFRSDDLVAGAALTSVAWAAVAVGFVVMGAAGRRLAARTWEGALPSPYAPAFVPTSLVIGAIYAAALAPTASLLIAWILDGGFDHDFVVMALGGWFLLGCATASAAGGLTGLWLARAPAGPIRAGASARQLELAGAVLVCHWAVPFLVTLFGEPLPWARTAVVLISAIALLGGTAAWSAGRTVRVRASA